MPSVIYFNAADNDGAVGIVVEEDPDQVATAYNAAGGLPFRLMHVTREGSLPVYVNPPSIAYWAEPSERARQRVEQRMSR
jgi:hypothetical protein